MPGQPSKRIGGLDRIPTGFPRRECAERSPLCPLLERITFQCGNNASQLFFATMWERSVVKYINTHATMRLTKQRMNVAL